MYTPRDLHSVFLLSPFMGPSEPKGVSQTPGSGNFWFRLILQGTSMEVIPLTQEDKYLCDLQPRVMGRLCPSRIGREPTLWVWQEVAQGKMSL